MFTLHWPEGFDPGVGRIGHLKSQLLAAYNRLARLINRRQKATAVYNKNGRRNLACHLWHELAEDVAASEQCVKKYVPTVRKLIGELDAIGGRKSYLVPDVFLFDLGSLYDCIIFPNSGGLDFLASDKFYFVEEELETFYLQDDPAPSTALLAHCMNRLQYFSIVECKAEIKYYQDYALKIFDEGVVIQKPSRLYDEVVKLKTDMAELKDREDQERERKDRERLVLREKVLALQRAGFMGEAFCQAHLKIFGVKYKDGNDSGPAQVISKAHDSIFGKNKKKLSDDKPAEVETVLLNKILREVHSQKRLKPITPISNQSQTSGPKTVFAWNLPYHIESGQVRKFFEEAGRVVDVRLAKHKDGRLKGYGHIAFSTTESAHKALEYAGRRLMGRCVWVDLAAERSRKTPGSWFHADGGGRGSRGSVGDRGAGRGRGGATAIAGNAWAGTKTKFVDDE